MNKLLHNNIPCEFSLTHYKHILESALNAGYRFGLYSEIEKTKDHTCVLRHDIDYTPLRAAQIGKIEKQLGIKAYYFFLINSEIYNIREHRVYKVVHDLREMGHYIGLHFDLSWNKEIKWQEVSKQCEREKELFEALTDIKPHEIISFHNPHIFTDLVLNKTVTGMEHTYEKRYFSDAKYLSDSQGWYEGCACKIFEQRKYPKIQLLTHPYIWPETTNGDFIEDMAEMIKDKRDAIADYMIKYHPVCERNKEKLRKLIL